MPRVSASTAAAVNAGVLRSDRAAKRRSLQNADAGLLEVSMSLWTQPPRERLDRRFAPTVGVPQLRFFVTALPSARRTYGRSAAATVTYAQARHSRRSGGTAPSL